MFSLDIQRHAGEFAKALASNKYEKTHSGIYFPDAKVSIVGKGRYTHTVNGKDERVDENLLTDEGIAHLLNVGLFSTAKISAFYVAPFQANATPLVTWNGANYNANATEVTSLTEGYSETTRPLWVSAVSAGGAINNNASRAEFTIVSAASVTWYGAGLLSTNVRGDTGGKLISAARFATPRVLANTDVWGCGYEIDLTTA